MKITIVGAGNVGTQFAVHCAVKGHSVIIYGSSPEKINEELYIINEKNEIAYKGRITKATNNESEAFNDADVIFIIMPATMMNENAAKIEPFVKKGMKICLVPGIGGGECAFKRCIEKGAVLFGMQRIPSVARLVEYGRTVKAIGYRKELFVCAIPHAETLSCCKFIEELFEIKTSPLPNYLNITLTPSNPILHTTRLKKIYENYHDGVVYDEIPLFYENWDNATSDLLLKCDFEVQLICKQLKQFDLSYVKSLKIHYESDTIEKMTDKLSSIQGFKGLTSPSIKVENGYIPDFSSRYFTSDFSYGLEILIQIAKFTGVLVPNMEETVEWYYALKGQEHIFRFSDYDINNLEDFIEFYSK